MKPSRRRWPRLAFSLRTVFVVLTALGIILAEEIRIARLRKELAAEHEKFKGKELGEKIAMALAKKYKVELANAGLLALSPEDLRAIRNGGVDRKKIIPDDPTTRQR